MNNEKQRVEFFGPLLLSLAFLVLFILGMRTISTSEIWTHLAAGRHLVQHGIAHVDPFSFGMPEGSAWRQTTWLYDFGVFVLWRLGGPALVVLAHISAVVAGYLLLIPVCRRFAGFSTAAAALLVCSWIMAPALVPTPLTMSLFFVGLFLFILNQQAIRLPGLIVLVVAQLLWANMHMSFILGPLLGILAFAEYKFSNSAQGSRPPAPRLIVILPFVLGLCTLANPAGFGLWKDLVAYVADRDRQVVLEWISPFFRDFLPIPLNYLSAAVLAMIAAVFILRRERLPLTVTCCAIVSAYLLVRSSHLVHVAAILAFPFLAMSFSTLAALSGLPNKPFAGIAGKTAIAVGVALSIQAIVSNKYYVASGSASSFGLRVNTHIYPAAFMEALNRLNIQPGNMLNLAHDGGFLLCQRLDSKVYADSRSDFYGAAFFAKIAQALTGQPDATGAQIPLPDADLILLNGTWSGARAATTYLLGGGDWAVAYFDGTSLLLARKTGGNDALFARQDLQQIGLMQIQSEFARYKRSLDESMQPPNPARLIGAGAIYQTLGRHEEALPIYELLTRGTPRMASAWFNRGVSELSVGKNTEAVQSLTRAARLTPKQILPWLWLGQANLNLGDKKGADNAFRHARKLNPDITSRFESEIADKKTE